MIVNLMLAAALAAGDVERRVNDLLARMTLDEKIGQTVQDSSGPSSAAESQDASDRKVAQAFLARLSRGEIGTLLGACGIENFNRCQRAAMASRLRIPLLVGHDFIHGCVTTLPIPLALSCSWDEKLWWDAGDLIGREGLLKGANWTFTPMLDVARDARWGRIAECAGQDPLVASRYAAAMVRGIQGPDLSDRTHIAACLKHYVGYGAASGGRDYNEVEMSDSTLRDIYLPPFAAGVSAGALTVMPGFHAYNGVPCSVNPYLLRTLLRDELGFRGFTISDWGAVGECSEIGHSVAEGDVDTAALAMNAGMDQEMMRGFYVRGLKKAVEDGKVSMDVLDAAVANVLRVKVKMGLFEKPYLDGAVLSNNVDFAVHRALARKAAAKSCVLLKNAKGTLPLAKTAKVAFVGDLCADDKEMKGTWQLYWENFETPSLKAAFSARGVRFAYEPAYTVTGTCDRAAIRRVAADADVVIGAFGEYCERMPMSGENTSRVKLELSQGQLDAIDEIRKTGKPFVAVLFNGRPLPVPELAEAADAILEAWHPGGVGGPGLADVIYGDSEPYGRLTVDFPRATGQCPIYYNRTPTGRPHKPNNYWTTKYTDCEFTPLYPFGFGLTYTTFAYSDEKAEVKDGKVVFSATLANTGGRGGSEVVQIYVRDRIASVTRPVRELKGYVRVELKPGESRRVAVEVPFSAFAFHCDGKLVAGKGSFDAWIASDSASGRRIGFELH